MYDVGYLISDFFQFQYLQLMAGTQILKSDIRDQTSDICNGAEKHLQTTNHFHIFSY